MATPFQRIGIFGRLKTEGVRDTLLALAAYLHANGHPVSIEADTAAHVATDLPIVNSDALKQHCDLLIVVGGDGSLLHAAHIAVDQDLPVLGINRGNLGFLTDILPDALPQIGAILAGQYHEEARFLLHASVRHPNSAHAHGDALNEVAISPATFPHMTEFEIYIDDQFVCSQHADGLIVATPTGSTAYALSGGGPILHPQLDAIVLVPMFSHSLTNRPIVVAGNSTVRIVISPNSQVAPSLSCDSRTGISLMPGSIIDIHKKTKSLRLIHPLDYEYYASLRSKLYWGRKLIC